MPVQTSATTATHHVAVPDRLYAGYIFDLDGTIYLGNTLLPGVSRLITALRQLGKRVVFLSNNPTRDVAMHAQKLERLGLPTPAAAIVTTVFTTTQWLLQNAPHAVVYPIAEEPLIRSLRQHGIRISEDPQKIDLVIASYDRTLVYRKLQIAFEAIYVHRRARLICTNADHFCPFPDGHGEVDAGAVIAAIENSTGCRLAVNCGKPASVMLETIMNVMQLGVRDCIVTGDRLYTDIRMGIDAGMDTALVFTGETTPALLAGWPAEGRPTYTLDRIDRLLPPALWEEFGWADTDGCALPADPVQT
ncbi:MAG: HAD-IIA family hydrolase [Anaerolineae bacterium]|nr:MAG: HAD-IIA family hydrolase [Anaerolineae bacterium]